MSEPDDGAAVKPASGEATDRAGVNSRPEGSANSATGSSGVAPKAAAAEKAPGTEAVPSTAVEQPAAEAATERPGTLPKRDPEAVALRARPSRASRFKREIIVGGAGLFTLSIALVAFIALRPTEPHFASQGDTPPISNAAPEVLSGLPTTYGAAPRLGPPLPGDLGRGILEHQRTMATENSVGGTARDDQAAMAEQERRAADLKAARESGLLVQSGARVGTAVEPQPSVATATAATDPAKIALDPEHDPNAQQHKADFVATADKAGDVNPHTLTAIRSPYTLSAGSMISASLITGLRSDLPGLVTAQVTERVYDSATGRILLIPQGARLIGTYDSVVAFGQRRALVVWQRIILPDGSSLQIDNVPATDPSGYAGIADKVDFHTWTLLKGVAISTLLGVGTSLTFTGESDLVQAIRESTQQNVSRAGDQLTSRNLQIQPTITIRPGTPVRLVVHRDLIVVPTAQ